jgi:hypothetical protein
LARIARQPHLPDPKGTILPSSRSNVDPEDRKSYKIITWIIAVFGVVVLNDVTAVHVLERQKPKLAARRRRGAGRP